MPNAKKYIIPWVTTFSDPNVSDSTPKIKIELPIFNPGPEVSKRVWHDPTEQKLKEEIDFEETGHFWPMAVPGRPTYLRPNIKITCRALYWS